MQGEIHPLHSAEQRRRHQAVQADAPLDEAVEPDGVVAPIGQPAEEAVADGQSTHEHRQDDRLCLDGAPQHQRQMLGPHHFIHQRRGARTEEKKWNHHQSREGLAVAELVRVWPTASAAVAHKM